jgi:hypothetical protein
MIYIHVTNQDRDVSCVNVERNAAHAAGALHITSAMPVWPDKRLILQFYFVTGHTHLERNTNKCLRFDASRGIVRQVGDARPEAPLLSLSKPPRSPKAPDAARNRGRRSPGAGLPSNKSLEERPMSDTNPSTRPKRSKATLAQRVLASLVAGAGVDEISATEQLTRACECSRK